MRELRGNAGRGGGRLGEGGIGRIVPMRLVLEVWFKWGMSVWRPIHHQPRVENSRMDLSVIVPLYNEEESVGPLHAAIDAALSDLELEAEVLFVDDGSTDHTFQRAREIALGDPRVKVVRFRGNFGQTPAMSAGIDHATGDILVTMDGDLQNDPGDIPRFIEKMREGYDIVVGWRHKRQDKLITRKIPSKIANWMIGKITGVPIKDNGCSLKAYRASVIKRIPLYSEMHRFIPAMCSLAGARVAEIKVRHHARRFGTSKYGLSRIYRVLFDLLAIKMIISFAQRPLAWFSLLALPAMAISAVSLIAGFYAASADGSAFSIPLAGTGVLFGALACFLILSGVLAELVYKSGEAGREKLWYVTARAIEKDSRSQPSES